MTIEEYLKCTKGKEECECRVTTGGNGGNCYKGIFLETKIKGEKYAMCIQINSRTIPQEIDIKYISRIIWEV